MSFRRPVGAQADVKELEYIAALHQTCLPHCRENGTVSSVDIKTVLRSRIGAQVDHSHCLRVVRGLGGGVLSDEVIQKILDSQESDQDTGVDAPEGTKRLQKAKQLFNKRILRAKSEKDVEAQLEEEPESQKEEAEQTDEPDNVMDGEEPEEYLDIVQLVAALIIPTLARAGKEWRESNETTLEDQTEKKDEDKEKGWFGKLEAWDDARTAQRENEIYQTLRPPPNLIQDALTVLLLHVKDGNIKQSTSSKYPTMSAVLVQHLLEACGEHERAADSQLIQRMVEVASSSSGLLDEEAFVNAITSDVSAFPVESDGRLSSTFYDIYGFDTFQDWRRAQLKEEESKVMAVESQNELHEDIDDDSVGDGAIHVDATTTNNEDASQTKYELSVPRMMSSVDFAIDAHSSVALMIFIWVFFILTTVLYATLIQTLDALKPKCDEKAFSCRLSSTIITWVIYAVIFTATGFALVIPLSVGNTPRRRSPLHAFFSMVVTGFYTWAPYFIINKYQKRAEERGPPYNSTENAVRGRFFDQAQWIVCGIGIVLVVMYFVQLILALAGTERVMRSKLYRFIVNSNVRGVARTKKAATRKINTLLRNAHRLHPSVSGIPSISSSSLRAETAASEEAMVNFVVRGQRFENCGGFIWTWKMLLSGRLFDEEGVWIMSRLAVIQIAQLVVAVLFAYAFFSLVKPIADEADDATRDLKENYENLPNWVYDIVPTGRQVKGALYPAAVVGTGVMLVLMLIYIPSYVATMLYYRCGLLPSLQGIVFTKYRTNVDTVYGNIANAVYAMVGSAVLFWALFAILVFLFVWPFSQDFMFLITAWGIGLCVTIVLKMMMTKVCRKNFFAGLYRTRPGAANLSTLALECWFIGLGGGVLIGRFTQFILAACFWIGRTDVPFLSEDVSLFGYGFDYVPTNFVKDLLMHDAHHHPYLERLFMIYLLKLKENSFCSDAGACWRQLFVVSFMPWLMKYRVFSDRRLADAMESYNKRRLELEEEKHPKGIIGEVKTGWQDIADQIVDQRPPKGDDNDEMHVKDE